MTNRLLDASLLAGLAVGLGAPCLGGLCAVPAAAQETGGKEEPKEEVKGTEYHFGTSPARTTITFESETDLETIHGVVRAMDGTARFDWEKGVGAARLSVPVKEMKTGLDTRDEHLRTADWLHEEKYPTIIFEASSLKKKDEKGNAWIYEGHLTIRGVRKPLKGEATVLRIPEETGRVLGRGQWVKVKAEFPVTLKEFGIEIPGGAVQGKVSPTWKVKIDIYGTTEKPAR